MKSCPFCGHEVDLGDPDTLYQTGTFWRDNELLNLRFYVSRHAAIEGDMPCYSLNCPTPAGGCGAEMHGDSIEDVMKKWERRIG